MITQRLPLLQGIFSSVWRNTLYKLFSAVAEPVRAHSLHLAEPPTSRDPPPPSPLGPAYVLNSLKLAQPRFLPNMSQLANLTLEKVSFSSQHPILVPESRLVEAAFFEDMVSPMVYNRFICLFRSCFRLFFPCLRFSHNTLRFCFTFPPFESLFLLSVGPAPLSAPDTDGSDRHPSGSAECEQ